MYVLLMIHRKQYYIHGITEIHKFSKSSQQPKILDILGTTSIIIIVRFSKVRQNRIREL